MSSAGLHSYLSDSHTNSFSLIQKEARGIFNPDCALGYIRETAPKAPERRLGEKIHPRGFSFLKF